MALKVKAVERLLKFDKESAGKYRYVMKADLEHAVSGTLCMLYKGKLKTA